MTRNEYEQHKQRLETQRRESIELLEAFYRQQFLALELVWMASSGEEGVLPRSLVMGTGVSGVQGSAVAASPVPPPTEPAPEPARPRRWGPGELLNDVETVLPQLPEVFDYHQVLQALGNKPERTSLFKVLKELVKDGILEVEQAGYGKVPARYRRAAPAGAGDLG